MARKYTYHRENCDCFIRETITDVWGRVIILGGQHAYNYLHKRKNSKDCLPKWQNSKTGVQEI